MIVLLFLYSGYEKNIPELNPDFTYDHTIVLFDCYSVE